MELLPTVGQQEANCQSGEVMRILFAAPRSSRRDWH